MHVPPESPWHEMHPQHGLIDKLATRLLAVPPQYPLEDHPIPILLPCRPFVRIMYGCARTTSGRTFRLGSEEGLERL